MEKILFALIIPVFLGINAMSAHSPQHRSPKVVDTAIVDTMKYLQSIIMDHQVKYVHGELKTILGDLHLSVRSYLPDLSNAKIVPSISIFFYPIDTVGSRLDNKIKICCLTFEFQPAASLDSVFVILAKDHGNWSPAAERYFSRQIVSTITLFDNSYPHTSKAQ
jgi:hypothetical protein